MIARSAGACATLFAWVAAGAPTPPPAAFEREILGASSGPTAIRLDPGIYERARPDLGDLRIRDSTGATVPYLLDSAAAGPATEALRPQLLNRTFVRRQRTSVTLDFGHRVRKRELALRLSGDNFRRRVMVEAGTDGLQWAVLTDSAFVFAVPGPNPARYETVPFPENDLPRLRVTVFAGPDDADDMEILDAAVRGSGRAREEKARVLTPAAVNDDRARETILTVDLGARHQPFHALQFEVAEARFFRGVAVEARRDPAEPRRGPNPGPVEWALLREGALYRYGADDGRGENLRIDVTGRERVLRLRVHNRDDRPITIHKVTVWEPVERVLFEAAAGHHYWLTYGAPALGTPDYDLARTANPDTLAASATLATLAPAVPSRAASGAVPWTERHPALLWAGLVVVVGLLGLVTWRALAKAG